MDRQRRIITQRLNSISLEAGFIAPFLRLGTNLFRLANHFRDIARAAGLSAGAIRLAGAAGVGFGLALKGLQIVAGGVTRILSFLATQVLRGLTAAFKTVFGPTLAFVGALRRLIQNLPIVTALLGGLLIRNLVEVGKRFQQIESVFRLAFGPRAQAEFERVISLARQFGVPLEAVSRGYARISVAAKGAGIPQ